MEKLENVTAGSSYICERRIKLNDPKLVELHITFVGEKVIKFKIGDCSTEYFEYKEKFYKEHKIIEETFSINNYYKNLYLTGNL